MKTSAANSLLDKVTQPNKGAGSNRRHAACRLIDTVHHLRRAARALRTLAPCHETELASLSRVRDRVEGIARLLSEATESLKLLGVSKNDPIIEIDGQRLGLQKLSRRLRKVRVQLDNEYAAMTIRTRSGVDPGQGGGDGTDKTPSGEEPGAPAHEKAGNIASVVAAGVALAVGLGSLFNDEDDDRARDRISGTTSDGIRQMDDNELVSMIESMLDGPTGDDDETAILKILEALDCERRIRIVNRVGLGKLLSDVDGAEWHRLVNLLTECGIGFDQMDDDHTRLFVNNQSCSQLSQLEMRDVRQLVLNMFSGSCGDDDEDAILTLLRCQSCPRLHHLVAMPGTDVRSFDYNFDGDQWDDLEALFAACGIVLDA